MEDDGISSEPSRIMSVSKNAGPLSSPDRKSATLDLRFGNRTFNNQNTKTTKRSPQYRANTVPALVPVEQAPDGMRRHMTLLSRRSLSVDLLPNSFQRYPPTGRSLRANLFELLVESPKLAHQQDQFAICRAEPLTAQFKPYGRFYGGLVQGLALGGQEILSIHSQHGGDVGRDGRRDGSLTGCPLLEKTRAVTE